MDNTQYVVMFCGIESGQEIEPIKQKLAALYKGNIAKTDRFFVTGKPVIIKTNLDYQTAQKLQNTLSKRVEGAIFKIGRVSPKTRVQETTSEKQVSPASKDYAGISHYNEAIRLHSQGGALTTVVTEFEMAISTGLPTDSLELTDVYAYLGYAYISLYANELGRDHSKLEKVTMCIEQALLRDVQQQGTYFSKVANITYLERFDIFFVLEKKLLRQQYGINEAIFYLEKNLRLVEHLQINPFPGVRLELGNLYAENEEFQTARHYWESLSTSSFIIPDSQWEQDIRKKAQENLQRLETQQQLYSEEACHCNSCKYRMPKHICGHSQSRFYNQKIDGNETTCEYAERNPAQTHVTNGLVKCIHLSPDTDMSIDEAYPLVVESNQEFEEALRLGLPADEEVMVRSFLANGYSMLTRMRSETPDVHSHEWAETFRQIEKAVDIDIQGGYGYFSELLNIQRLQDYDAMYGLQIKTIEKEQGTAQAVRYGEEKIRLFNKLPTNPLFILLLQLGVCYGAQNDPGNAKKCFQQILNTREIRTGDDDLADQEAGVRQKARGNLQIAEEQIKAKSGGCYIATTCYGSDHAPEVLTLRTFRDHTLSKSRLGRGFIRIYYQYAPYLASLLRERPAINRIIREHILDRIVRRIAHP